MAGAGGSAFGVGGWGGAGLNNRGIIITLTNTGTISGGAGGDASTSGGPGGAGVSNSGHDHDAGQQRKDQR